MKKLLVLLIVFTIGCNAQTSELNPMKDNEIQVSQNEEVYLLKQFPTETEYHNFQSKVREFIWLNWKASRLCQLKTSSYTKEGEKINVTYKFQSFDDNGLFISVSIERDFSDTNPTSPTYKKILKGFRKYLAFNIDRIVMPKDGVIKRKVISKNSNRSPKSYMIRLKDKDGKILAEI